MKKHLISALLLFTCLQLIGQDELPWKYRGLYLGAGPRVLTAEAGTINFNFIDNSPSMDNLSSSTLVEDSYNSVGVQFGFMWGKYKGLSYDVNFDISKTILFDFSLGYTFSMAKGYNSFSLRPAIMVGGANYHFDLGDLVNNAGYIQIGEREYYGEYLETKLSSQATVWGPQLDLFANFGEHFGAFAKFNLDIASSTNNSDINFINPSPGDGESSNFASISIDENTTNPDIEFNGEKLINLPYNSSGLRLSVGVVYFWNKFR